MEPILASNGQYVDEAMVDRWCAALDRDEWPEGEHNIGPIINGAPKSLSPEGTETLSVKVPASMMRAIKSKAKDGNMSTSELVRSMLAESLMAS